MNLPSPAGLLDRHQLRREAGLPTVSVLCGPTGLALSEARRWAAGQGRGVACSSAPRFQELVDAWVDSLSAERDLARDAIGWLARHSDRPDDAEELRSRLKRMTPLEQEALFDSAFAQASSPDTEAICRWLLGRWTRGEPIAGPGLAARLGEAFVQQGSDSDSAGLRDRVVAALGTLTPMANGPLLLVSRNVEADRDPLRWLEAAAQALARLAQGHPSLAAVLAIESAEFELYNRNVPESRAKSLIRSGVIAVRGLDEGEIVRRIDHEVPGASARLDGTVRRLVADGASEQVVSHLLEAVKAAAAPRLPEAGRADPARSAAERFLFECLESSPATAGLFELNRILDFRFGPTQDMEVDLFAQELGIAVEVDGYYHFQGPEAYRRDRRKDLELQRRGHLVVRVLAEDVVSRLEQVLAIILDAVSARGGRTHRQRGEIS